MNIKSTLLERKEKAKYTLRSNIKLLFLCALLLNYGYLGTSFGDDIANKYFTNADTPLVTPTYDGSNQAVHPSVLYIKEGFNGYKYWMALTPYPYGNDDYENPQILVSNDGIKFSYFKTLKSYLAIPEDVNLGGHYSDVNLCYTNNELELYFRYNPHLEGSKGTNNSSNSVYVMKSKDGLHWSDKKLVLSKDTFIEQYNYVSPTIIYENGLYNIWFSNYSTNLYHTQTKNWVDFEPVSTCKLLNKPNNINIWHHDIINTDEGYEAVFSAYSDNNSAVQSLYYTKSKDGINFSQFDVILNPSINSSFDNASLYKASLVNSSDKYLLYYSARNIEGQWHIGLAKSIGVH